MVVNVTFWDLFGSTVTSLESSCASLIINMAVKVPLLPPELVTIAVMVTFSPGVTVAGVIFKSETLKFAGAVETVVLPSLPRMANVEKCAIGAATVFAWVSTVLVSALHIVPVQ